PRVLAGRHPGRVPAQGEHDDEADRGQRRWHGNPCHFAGGNRRRQRVRLVPLADLLRAPGPRMAILVLAADGSGSAEPIDVDDPDIAPNGWIAWGPPTGDEILFRAHPTLLSPAAGLYAVDPAGGAPRTLLEPASGASNDDCAMCSIALSPDGRWATFWTWGPNDAGEVGGWGHVVNLSTGSERIATTWGGNTSPVTPD